MAYNKCKINKPTGETIHTINYEFRIIKIIEDARAHTHTHQTPVSYTHLDVYKRQL